MRKIIVVAHNIRSTFNVGSIFRTCEGFGVEKLILSGYTPYPRTSGALRLPHISSKLSEQISKTALGAEEMVDFEYQVEPELKELKESGYKIVGLEQTKNSQNIRDYQPEDKLVLVLGEEVDGIDKYILNRCDEIIEIPMSGKKESFNVSVATGIALYALTK
jgi:tRNA G18 (ribose-2'-O)-methylase SpoU